MKRTMLRLRIAGLRASLLALALVAAVAPAAAQDLGGPVPRARVAQAIAEGVAAGRPVEALILLDDTTARAAQAADLQFAAGQELHRLGAADYQQRIDVRVQALDAMKGSVRSEVGGEDVDEITDYPQFPILHVRIKSKAALERLRAHNRILSIDENAINRLQLAQSLPLIGQPQVQGTGQIGTGTTVCVLDTGVDYTRPAFGSCAAPGGACRVAYAADFAPDDGARDADGHGTNVSAIVLGVAPGARIAALDVFEGEGAYTSTIISAINWCVTNKALYNVAAISMSLGGGRSYAPLAPTDSWGTAMQSAVNAGIVVVAASGNDGYTDSLSSPAAYANVVSVGAVYDSNMGALGWSTCSDASTAADKVTCFSNSASFLTLLAPGSKIAAAGIQMSGTSQATPHVAGAVAVLRAAHPEYASSAIANALKVGVQVMDARNGIEKPRLHLPAALPPAGTLPLLATREGSGGGSVTSAPAGIACGATCLAYFASGDTVVLTATADPGSTFTGWAGDCTGTAASCSVSMSSGRSVSAAFALPDDNFPAGGEVPVGWATAPAANAGWGVAGDEAYRGSYSLKSATIGNSQSAAVQVGGTFAAGNVAFAYRVSSEAEFDFLRFYVDGILKVAGSGELPWTQVSYPVAAGTHTFLWTYSKDGSVSSGADAAWIDAVVLPSVPGLIPPSACSVSVTPSSLPAAGGTVSVAGVCAAGAPATSWSWTLNSNALAVTASGFASLLAANVGAVPAVYSYAGTACNSAGCAAAGTGIATVAVPVGGQASTTVLAASVNPSWFGQPATFSATVTGSAPTGTVAFADNGMAIAGCSAAALAGGMASCTTGTLVAGSHTITAGYAGDAANAPSSASLIQIVNASLGGTPLTNGRTVTRLSGATGSARYFYIDVPSGATNLVVQTSGGTGDLNLYVRRDALPTTGGYDCRSAARGVSTERCTFATPVQGRYYVLLWGYGAYAAGSLQASYVSGVTPPPPPASPTLQIGSASYSVDEGAGSVTIAVSRTGGTTGPATVRYATADGTATAGADYTASSGTLSFGAGVGTQDIVVPILNDTAVEGSEAFTVTLSSPSGAVLGSPGSTTVTIADNDASLGGTALTNGRIVGRLSGSVGSARYFYIDVPAGATNLLLQTSGGIGDVSLYVRREALPTTGSYDCRSTARGLNSERCVVATPMAGRYYVMLWGYAAYSGLSLQASFATASGSVRVSSGMADIAVTALSRAQPSPTMASTLSYALTFSAAVSGVGAGNLELVTTGISGASIGSISGAGANWTVSINTGRGTGTLQLNLVNASGIVDGFGTPLALTPYAGEIYAIDKGGSILGGGQGQPDASFGSGGYALFNLTQGVAAPGAIAVSSDGKILAAGGVGCDPSTGRQCVLQLRQYLGDGTPDASFAPGGAVLTGVSGIAADLSALIVDSDGTSFVVGTRRLGANDVPFVARFAAHGAPIVAYGNGGLAVLDGFPAGATVSGATVDGAGRLVVDGTRATSSGTEVLTVRLTPTGSIDAAFGVGGVISRYLAGATGDFGDRKLALQADGKIVLVGAVQATAGGSCGVARFTIDGTPDASFGANGQVLIPMTQGCVAVTIEADGKLIVTARDRHQDVGYATFARLLADGTPDTAFGTQGVQDVSAYGGPTRVVATAGGKLLTGLVREDPADGIRKSYVLQFTIAH